MLTAALCVALLGSLALTGRPATAAARVSSRPGAGRVHRWKAYQGPYFNDPHLRADHFKIEGKIIDTIRHARKG
jgi:hypothetical protein